MSYIGNSPGVSSQRVVTEEVVSGSPKSAFYPVGGYALGYVDVLVNGVEVDSSDFTASDGVVVTLATAAAVGETVKIKCFMPRGLSDGYLKAEADAKFLSSTNGSVTPAKLSNTASFTALEWIAQGSQAALWAYDRANNGKKVAMYAHDDLLALYGSVKVDDLVTVNQNTGDVAFRYGNLVLASGKGIDFSAHSNASGMTGELLDDYETGTWTPTYIAATTNPTLTYQVNTGTYVKIGKLVYVTCRIRVNTISGGSGQLYLAGLPFTSINNDNSFGGASLSYKNGWVSNGPSLFRMFASTSIEMYISNATNETPLTPSNLTGGADLIVNGLYQTY